jgi:hypothetical protein
LGGGIAFAELMITYKKCVHLLAMLFKTHFSLNMLHAAERNSWKIMFMR